MVVYNPMTGTRRDLEVEREDGKQAAATHERWRAQRIAYLERILPGASPDAQDGYRRELAALQRGPR
jgi:hypothetical protein